MRNDAPGGGDPRRQLDSDALHAASLRAAPQVARPARAGDNLGFVFGVLGAIALGGLTLVLLSWQRQAPPPAPPPPVSVPVTVPAAAPAITAPVAIPAKAVAPAADDGAPQGRQSRAMPMIIDNSVVEPAAAARSGEGKATAAAGEGRPAGAVLNADEQFAVRIGDDAPPLAQAVALAHPQATVVQGTIIPAVLETALNTDLPGYARAIVSRDVRSFDTSVVLIPRGSRLVGQYRSGISTGQSRAYIIWSRVIRPDGVSVQLGSPAIDGEGQTGLPGEVNRHFWQRYGASILLSVVGGAASALGGDTGTLVIGTSANSASAQALSTDGKIPPTIQVPLGTPIQVFTARDLDFSGD
ncbi:TrbI/VirB10 family protein [Pseudoxanthomonas sp.]|uniref:TrbI/VirB10 family protein n=1 Tax=Pseudoxanthomonas sp. TaxID=1871049 RepID=UPI00261510C9|nr:TrbI/VirB10 family protein [Pseudoxanthomonas sp.]WDS35484.1 MAG: TrbI/VirB10 family protein [Pseudoxanthomonas sp.]